MIENDRKWWKKANVCAFATLNAMHREIVAWALRMKASTLPNVHWYTQTQPFTTHSHPIQFNCSAITLSVLQICIHISFRLQAIFKMARLFWSFKYEFRFSCVLESINVHLSWIVFNVDASRLHFTWNVCRSRTTIYVCRTAGLLITNCYKCY